MALTSALTPSGPIVCGRPSNFVCAITNGAATTVSVSSVSLSVTPLSGGVTQGAINLGPSVSTSIAQNATLYVPFSLTFHSPAKQGGAALTPPPPGLQYLVSANVLSSDGTASVSPMISVSPSTAINTPAGGDVTAANGQVRFDTGFNSGELVLVSPP